MHSLRITPFVKFQADKLATFFNRKVCDIIIRRFRNKNNNELDEASTTQFSVSTGSLAPTTRIGNWPWRKREWQNQSISLLWTQNVRVWHEGRLTNMPSPWFSAYEFPFDEAREIVRPPWSALKCAGWWVSKRILFCLLSLTHYQMSSGYGASQSERSGNTHKGIPKTGGRGIDTQYSIDEKLR